MNERKYPRHIRTIGGDPNVYWVVPFAGAGEEQSRFVQAGYADDASAFSERELDVLIAKGDCEEFEELTPASEAKEAWPKALVDEVDALINGCPHDPEEVIAAVVKHLSNSYDWQTACLESQARELALRAEVVRLGEALKLCHKELRFMLNTYPKRRGGLYENALVAASAALNIPTGLHAGKCDNAESGSDPSLAAGSEVGNG